MLQGIALQSVKKIGVSKRNHGLCSFGTGLALQVDHAELCDDLHHVRPRCGHRVSSREDEPDSAGANAMTFIGRGETDERPTILGPIRAERIAADPRFR